jgi:serine/threonine protein kinase
MAFSLKDYTDIEEIASGGMGKVYLATQISLNRKVIIKEMRTGILANEVDILRFENEARAAAALDHDTIIRIYDFGEDHGSFFISMEYIDGPDLDEVLKGNHYLPEIGLMILLQALRGLQFAHQHEIIHRDVKPGNILISKGGAVKVVDFGLAHAVKRPLNLTTTDVIIGTPLFMSPEQATGEERKDVRMDIWAVGVLLYRIVTGNYPFGGNNVPAILYNIMQTKEVPVGKAAPALPDDLIDIINRCLEKNRSRRLDSLLPIIDSLQNLFFDIGIKDTAEQLRHYLHDKAGCVAALREQLIAYHTRKANAFEAAEAILKTQAHIQAARKLQPGAKPGSGAFDAIRKRTSSFFNKSENTSAARKESSRLRLDRHPVIRVVLPLALLAVIGAGLLVLLFQKPHNGGSRHLPAAAQNIPAANPLNTRDAGKATPSAAVDNDTAHNRSSVVETTSPPLSKSNSAPVAPRVQSKATAAPESHKSSTPAAMAHTRISADSGVLKITLSPSSSEVSVDGAAIPPSDLIKGKKIQAGAHTVIANAPGFDPYAKTVIVENGSTQILAIELSSREENAIAAIHVHSYPWAEIYIDGVFRGNSPTAKPIPCSEGSHLLELRRDGYNSHVETINVSKGEIKKIKVQLAGK